MGAGSGPGGGYPSGSSRMELGSERAAREDRVMAELAEEFPDWEVERVWGVGFVGFPKGTVILRSIDIGAMRTKLERLRDEPGAEPQ